MLSLANKSHRKESCRVPIHLRDEIALTLDINWDVLRNQLRSWHGKTKMKAKTKFSHPVSFTLHKRRQNKHIYQKLFIASRLFRSLNFCFSSLFYQTSTEHVARKRIEFPIPSKKKSSFIYHSLMERSLLLFLL